MTLLHGFVSVFFKYHNLINQVHLQANSLVMLGYQILNWSVGLTYYYHDVCIYCLYATGLSIAEFGGGGILTYI